MRLGSLFGWFLMGIACSREPAQPLARSANSTAPTPSASASGGAPVAFPAPATPTTGGSPTTTPTPAAKPPELAAWTDPAAIEALTLDCNFKPPARSADEPEPSPLSCASGLYEQSCIYDPCYATDQSQCKPRCEKACGACSDQCSTACGRCKARCSDDGCRRACAETCANCKQECLATKDRCATGTCGSEYKACTELLTKRWNSSGCAKTCKTYQECTTKCQEAPACQASTDPKACDGCSERCAAQVKRGCPREFVDLCLFNGAAP